MGLLDLIWDSNKHALKKLEKKALLVETLADDMKKKSDENLRQMTEYLKKRYQEGETLDDLLVEAFAVVREGARRVLGLFPFHVQIMGAIALHNGDIAEMRTGEGKTLTSTMPVYLNALSGRGVHVVTVNEYLVQRDAEEMGKLFTFLGLTVGVNLNSMNPDEKREAYSADITYSTNNELGFDYLRDNMVLYSTQKVQRPLYFAVVDEVDSILIDESRTPLIISGTAEKSTQLYVQANAFVKTLTAIVDYTHDEKTKSVQLTEMGMNKAESAFGIDNLFDIRHVALNHHINQALHANVSMTCDVDYVVDNGEIIIVDSFTGRLMHGRRYSDGLHQAIEAKEGLKVQNESMTLATITFQNYFRMYEKLSGMTGTAKTEEEEFRNIYNMQVIAIPTNKKVIRIDNPDLIYASTEAKLRAVVENVYQRHKIGQPVLLGTVAIETSEYISKLLTKKGVPHNVLNAKQHEREAEIIQFAGRVGAVTIATNMAGRGTDIKLDEESVKLGGLAVIGTERHESRRIDNQLRGRSGRQGDPGYTQFYLSLDDELMRRFGSDNMRNFMVNRGFSENDSIQSKVISRAVESAQKRVEGNNFDSRKQLLQYDDVLRQQREIIYKQRNEVLESDDLTELIKKLIESSVRRHFSFAYDENELQVVDTKTLADYLNMYIFPPDKINEESLRTISADDLVAKVFAFLDEKTSERQELLLEEQIKEFQKVIVLKAVDSHWMSHIDSMEQLRSGIHLRAYAQIDPLREYQAEGLAMFEIMIGAIEDDVTRYMMKADIVNNLKREEVVKANAVAPKDGEPAKRQPKRRTINEQTKRNAPCPCGSGLKYKNCHGK